MRNLSATIKETLFFIKPFKLNKKKCYKGSLQERFLQNLLARGMLLHWLLDWKFQILPTKLRISWKTLTYDSSQLISAIIRKGDKVNA